MTSASLPARSSLLQNSLWRLGQVLGGSGISALTVLLYARLLPKSDYGFYGTLSAVVALGQVVAGLGLRQAVPRFVALSIGEGRKERARAYALAGLGVGAISASAVALLLLVVGLSWGEELLPGVAAEPVAIAVSASVLAKTLTGILQGGLEGSGAFREVSIASLAQALLVLLTAGVLSFAGLGIAQVLLTEAAAAALVVVWLASALRRKLRHGPSSEGPAVTRDLMLFSLPLLVNGIAGFFYGRVDLLFIHAWLTPADSADYFLMLGLFDFPLLAVGAYVSALNADVAHAAGAGERLRIRAQFYRSEAVGLGMGLVFVLVFYGASYVLPALLPGYEGAMSLMRLAAPLLAVKCIAQIASGAFMVSLGRAKTMAALTLVGGMLNVLLDWLLIPRFGVDGAVYATLLGHGAVGLLSVGYIAHLVNSYTRQESPA